MLSLYNYLYPLRGTNLLLLSVFCNITMSHKTTTTIFNQSPQGKFPTMVTFLANLINMSPKTKKLKIKKNLSCVSRILCHVVHKGTLVTFCTSSFQRGMINTILQKPMLSDCFHHFGIHCHQKTQTKISSLQIFLF